MATRWRAGHDIRICSSFTYTVKARKWSCATGDWPTKERESSRSHFAGSQEGRAASSTRHPCKTRCRQGILIDPHKSASFSETSARVVHSTAFPEPRSTRGPTPLAPDAACSWQTRYASGCLPRAAFPVTASHPGSVALTGASYIKNNGS